jgi:hypothetical protein
MPLERLSFRVIDSSSHNNFFAKLSAYFAEYLSGNIKITGSTIESIPIYCKSPTIKYLT